MERRWTKCMEPKRIMLRTKTLFGQKIGFNQKATDLTNDPRTMR